MTIWIIEPHDPLIVRDGRPFGPDPGARAHTLSFPLPSTVTGGARSRIGQDAHGHFVAKPEEVRQIPVLGPLLVELNEEALGALAQDQITWFAPAPADALLFAAQPVQEVAHTAIQPLVPLSLPTGAAINLPSTLAPVGLAAAGLKAKPLTQPPRFWFWTVFEAWLCQPISTTVAVASVGVAGPTTEHRLHVSIDAEKQAATEGALFQTSGLEFALPFPASSLPPATDALSPSVESPPPLSQERSLARIRRLALAVGCDDARLPPGLAPLGGERRMMGWRRSAATFPACPSEIIEQIAAAGHCRLILLTPALFRDGLLPSWSGQPESGVTATVEAVAAPRYQVLSGWDLAAPNGGRAKPSRRAAPAGAVYFLTLKGTPDHIRAWVKAHWIAPVSDDAQDRLDGFGLAVLGTWDGRLHTMEGA